MDKATFILWIRTMSSGVICTNTGISKYAEIDRIHGKMIEKAMNLENEEVTFPYRTRDRLFAETMEELYA